jgi:hypothetical protein
MSQNTVKGYSNSENRVLQDFLWKRIGAGKLVKKESQNQNRVQGLNKKIQG